MRVDARRSALLAVIVITTAALASCARGTDPVEPAPPGERAATTTVSVSELSLALEPVDDTCDMGRDFRGTARVRWTVEGGRAPYEVWVNGELLPGESGVVDVRCVGLRGMDPRSGTRTGDGLPLTVVGTAIDAGGVRASDLLLIRRSAADVTAPGDRTQGFPGGIDALTLELFAPRICDAREWETIGWVPFVGTGADDVAIEVEWRVSGGQPPYTVYLAGGEFEGDSGTLRIPCRHDDERSDAINPAASWIDVTAFARDAAGAVASGIVETLAMPGLDAWTDLAIGGPDLSSARWLNPAPLRIAAYADPLLCDSWVGPATDDDTGFVYVRVGGGGWVPTGIELNGEVIALARGTGGILWPVDCSGDPGSRQLRLNVHDLGPPTPGSRVETTIETIVRAPPSDPTGLRLGVWKQPYHDPPAFDPTAYCEPGGWARVAWMAADVYRGDASLGYGPIEKPLRVLIDGELAVSQAHFSQISIDFGEHWVECRQEPGLQTVVIEATDSGTPRRAARLEYPIRVVESHPSGMAWSEIRPDDYPE